ncbi:MAG TPA: hypothetical protein VLF71_05260 [Candidatus Saccharimonadales bacterium]|nr:hypothetical protein [Candidatus Saccharimonadales bacterium]
MRRLRLALLLAACASGLWMFVTATPASAAINKQISFEGKLTNTDGTNVTDGTYSIRFRIYTDPSLDAGNTCSANTCKWEETQASVSVSGGLFQVNLGSSTPLPANVDFNTAALYLGVKVGSDAEMTPRIQLTAAPYAFNSDLLDGIDSTGFVQLSSGNINIGSGTITSGAINGNTFSSSALTFGAASTATVQSAASQALTVTGNAASTWSTTAGNLTLQAGSGTVSLGSSTVLSSSGTLAVNSGAATALTIDSGTTGALNLGTGSNAKTINIGNTTGATAIAHLVGASTTAFTVQGASSAVYLSLDTSNSRLYVGNPTADTTGLLLVLDTKNSTGDPTEVDGGMYYNSANNRFRCGQNGAWVNCIGGTMSTNTAASSAVNTCTTACASFTTNASLPANFCVPGRVFHVVASGVYSTAASATLAMGVYIGTNAATKTSDTLIGASSGALTSGAAVTNQGWNVDFYIGCFTSGSSGTVTGQGNFSMATSATANAAGGRMYSSATTTVNTTTAQNIYLFPAWGTSAAGDTATVQQFIVTAM